MYAQIIIFIYAMVVQYVVYLVRICFRKCCMKFVDVECNFSMYRLATSLGQNFCSINFEWHSIYLLINLVSLPDQVGLIDRGFIHAQGKKAVRYSFEI